MKNIRLNPDNRVAEIIPEAACTPSIAHWYGDVFAAQCREAPDEVACGWVYDSESQTFSAPPPQDPVFEPDQIQVLTAEVESLKAALGVLAASVVMEG